MRMSRVLGAGNESTKCEPTAGGVGIAIALGGGQPRFLKSAVLPAPFSTPVFSLPFLECKRRKRMESEAGKGKDY